MTALLDFLKNKEQAQKSKKAAKKPVKVSDVKKIEKTEIAKPASAKAPAGKAKSEKFSYEAIKQPHISEKASYLGQIDQYIFEVSPNYNKNEIKKSVEGIYGVDVLSVNIIKIPAKKRRLGRTEGFRKAYKKAIVKIKNGQKIEIL
ncbi:MAG: 50S ribosomal protein L23 [Candidatus Staskawiczbacteria bacterium]|nr:50S ribosomal protein L23 [Candidatus Staskawiczbacteria bacterium]